MDLTVKKKSFSIELPLLFAIFLDLVGFGMTFPDVQLRAQTYGAPGWMIGAILSSYYLVQMIASPRWGKLSDRKGRKPVLLLCGALSAASMVIYALGNSLGAMLLSRLAAGFGAANVVIAQAYLTDATDEQARAAAQGRMSAAVSAGLVLGPVIGGFLAQKGGNFLLGMAAAAASGLGAIWILIAVPSQVAPGARETEEDRPGFSLLKDHSALRRLFFVAIIGWFALACLEGTLGRLIQHTRGYGQLEFGLLLSVEAVVAVIQGALYPAFARRLGADALLVLSYLLQAIGLALMPFAPGLPTLILLSTLFGLGVGLATPTINGRASVLTPPGRQGEVFGLLQSSRALGFLFGPILGGLLFDVRAEAPYLTAAACLIGLGVWLSLAERHSHEHTHDPSVHSHAHVHDEHHQHAHLPGVDTGEPHTHEHTHEALTHRHKHYGDLHHRHRHG
ncbi:MAG: Arabinose efflux permease [Chthonomonadales bacterium]|nr:Arabinose efflux permease [Chthonomonadales bacterium]